MRYLSSGAQRRGTSQGGSQLQGRPLNAFGMSQSAQGKAGDLYGRKWDVQMSSLQGILLTYSKIVL